MKTEETKPVVKTRCAGCIFAVTTHTEQIGCWTNALDKFQDQDYTVEYEDVNNVKYCIINDKVCPFHRRQDWATAIEVEHSSSKMPLDLCAEYIRKNEAKLEADLIIHIPPYIESCLVELARTIDSVKSMDMQFNEIIIGNQTEMNILQLLHWCNINMQNMRFRIEHMIYNNQEPSDAITLLYKKCKSRYVTSCIAGYQFDPQYLSRIDKLIYDDLEPIVAIVKPKLDDINGYMIMRLVGKQAGFNRDRLLVYKLETISKEQKCQHLIKTYCDQTQTIQ
jgi:hypothetical protein